MLARVGEELAVPLQVTSTMEDAIGTNINDIQELAPAAYAARVRRGGTLNAFLDPTSQRRWRASGVKLIIAGLTSDICLYHTRGAPMPGMRLTWSPTPVASSVLADEVTFASCVPRRDDHRWQPGALRAVHGFRHRAGQKAQQINLEEIIERSQGAA